MIGALNVPLRSAGATATAAAGGGDAAGATVAGASDGQRSGASAAANRRSTGDIDRAIALEIKARQDSDARMEALLAERAAPAATE